MAIEKMIMLNVVGHKMDLDEVSKRVVLLNSVHPVDAIEEIDTTDFTFKATENNIKALEDVCYIRPYVGNMDYTTLTKKIKGLIEMCNLGKEVKVEKDELLYDIEAISMLADELKEKLDTCFNQMNSLREKREIISSEIEHLKYIEELNVDLADIWEINNFDFKIMKIPRENIAKLKYNYENIPSIVLKIYTHPEYSVYMVFAPKALKIESERIFKALNSEQINMQEKYAGTPRGIVLRLDEQLKDLDKNIKSKEKEMNKILRENQRKIFILKKSFELEVKSGEIKNYTAITDEFFYLCGWLPESSFKKFEKQMGDLYERLIIIKKKSSQINPELVPPTKLKNNRLTKPFEAMVNMYGIPSYKELDPTGFLAITYMLMFGIMFGDLGQGLVFVLAGLFLKYKKARNNLGGVLARIGVSSCIFGTLYGSFFGFENVIPPLVGRPMENIEQVLIYAIAFGCILLIIGYVYSFINCYKVKNLKEGIFGSNGMAGLLFYLTFIGFMVTKFTKTKFQLCNGVWITISIVLIMCILLKEPLANLLQKKRPLYGESKGDYYIESGFGILEVLLSMLSNTLSFIRVGAFAINHAGLFLAFSAIASMMNNGVGSAIMYLLGNLVIIGLEGLIVFIQGLRLEYYELFSKYYEGAGISYSPVGLNLVNDD